MTAAADTYRDLAEYAAVMRRMFPTSPAWAQAEAAIAEIEELREANARLRHALVDTLGDAPVARVRLLGISGR